MAGKKRGRPVKSTARKYFIKVRVNEDEADMINKIQAITGLNTSNIIRAALQLYYHMIVK